MFFFILGVQPYGNDPVGGCARPDLFGTTFAIGMCYVFCSAFLWYVDKFGVVGFWMNQIPSMDLPLAFGDHSQATHDFCLIEVLGLFIKHGVLAIRLLANMVAGHLVFWLSIMALAFSIEGAIESKLDGYRGNCGCRWLNCP